MMNRHLTSGAFLLLLSFSVCGQQLLLTVQQAKGVVAVYDVKKQIQLAEIKVGFKPHEIAYDHSSRLCYVSNFGVEDYDTKLGIPGNSISVIDPFERKCITTLFTTTDTTGNMPHGVKARPGKYKELFVNIERGDSMIVYSLPSYAVMRKFPVPAGTHNFIFSNDGRRLWLMCGNGGVAEINPGDGKTVHSQSTASPIRGLSFIGNDILASGKNEILILSGKDLSIKKQFGNLGVGQLFYSSATENGKLIICPAAFDSTVLILDAGNGNTLARLTTDKTPLQVQVAGNFAYITHPLDRHISVIDLKKMAVSGKIDIDGGNGILYIP